jgi:hypothetical protein
LTPMAVLPRSSFRVVFLCYSVKFTIKKKRCSELWFNWNLDSE